MRVIIKNNVPECVMISVEEYDRLTTVLTRPVKIIQTREEEERRKAFIQRIRQNIPAPIPPTRKLADVIQEVGAIDVDEEAVTGLRRLG